MRTCDSARIFGTLAIAHWSQCKDIFFLNKDYILYLVKMDIRVSKPISVRKWFNLHVYYSASASNFLVGVLSVIVKQLFDRPEVELITVERCTSCCFGLYNKTD
jgi:hypothetical protein